jgi:CHAT domain-containing protein
MTSVSLTSDGPDAPSRSRLLRQAFKLPAVYEEIEGIKESLPTEALFDESFTLANLSARLRDQSYSVVHIASHGKFGSNSDDSFLMTYDDLLKLDDLQVLLGRTRADRKTLEIISLSACHTAEGDDRAPLGMSGMAIRARAASVLGTLWDVDDIAARRVMTRFYERVAKSQASKAAALQSAQLDLIDKYGQSHPIYWAPFTLAGDWR